MPHSGGCQCGAVRYRIAEFGRATICHCRMCQKAFGGFFAPLVTAKGLEWTHGTLSTFASSNKVTRGFCDRCGTPLTYDWGGDLEVSIGSLDNPEAAPPVLQVNPAERLSFFATLHALPIRENGPDARAFIDDVVSHQHPDHDR